MKKVHVREAELATIDEGEGAPLLLVHGFPLDHSMWKHQIEYFASRRRVIAPDLRGFGQSEVTPSLGAMSEYADDLAGLLDELGVTERVTFCGLSMGGYVAWQFWMRHQDRIDKLILCDTRAIADSPEVRTTRERMIESVFSDGPTVISKAMLPKLFATRTREMHSERVAETERVILNSDRRGIAAALRAMASRPDVTDRLGEIDCPAVLICGKYDEISPCDEMREIAAKMPQAKFFEVPDAGHMAPLENPERVNEIIQSEA